MNFNNKIEQWSTTSKWFIFTIAWYIFFNYNFDDGDLASWEIWKTKQIVKIQQPSQQMPSTVKMQRWHYSCKQRVWQQQQKSVFH